MLTPCPTHDPPQSGWHVGRFKLLDRPGAQVAAKSRAQGELCIGVEFINYAQARQLEITKGQGGDAGSVAKYSDYSLTLKVHGSRGMLTKLKSGMRKGIYVESRWAPCPAYMPVGHISLMGTLPVAHNLLLHDVHMRRMVSIMA